MVTGVALLEGHIEEAIAEVLVKVHDHGSLDHGVLSHCRHLPIKTRSQVVHPNNLKKFE